MTADSESYQLTDLQKSTGNDSSNELTEYNR